jgi:hypothetical protein
MISATIMPANNTAKTITGTQSLVTRGLRRCQGLSMSYSSILR